MGSGPVSARLGRLIRAQVKIHQQISPNCGPRRNGLIPRFVVLHYTAMPTAKDAIRRLCDPKAEVSAHYVICKTGRVSQLVSEGQRAWHAGAGEWNGLTDMNSRSIGIELDNDGQGPFSDAQMQSLEALLAPMLLAWNIPPKNVIGHSDMAPGRKFDPGPLFDWPRLEGQGLAGPRGNGSAPKTSDPALFDASAHAAGYTAPVAHEARLAAVRLRYRPFAKGALTREDFAPLPRPDKFT